MRGLGGFMVSVPLVFAFACSGDDKAGAFVDEEAFSWRVRCGGGRACAFPAHEATETVELDVSCERLSAGSMRIAVRAPVDTENEIPTGQLIIDRLDPAAQTCIVRVTDSQSLEDSQIDVTDTCPASAGNHGCTVRGEFDVDGWDFAGTVSCDQLSSPALPAETYLLQNRVGKPITLRVDNCD